MTQITQTIAVYGATGFLGKNLIEYLLENTSYNIRAVSRHPEKLIVPSQYRKRVELYEVDVLNASDVNASLVGIDVAIYLIHMMNRKGDYDKYEARAATIFGKAAQKSKLSRAVYMSGLGNKKDKLSRHLASRHHTGAILKKYIPVVIELRASMIVGPGSAAYEIMRSFVKRLPFQVMPKWAVTRTQPIAIDDAVLYLTNSLTVKLEHSDIIDIGGPEVMTYKDLITSYAQFLNKYPAIIVFPYTPLWLASFWLNLFIPKRHARIGRQMAESLTQPMVVVNSRATELFPDIKPRPIIAAFT